MKELNEISNPTSGSDATLSKSASRVAVVTTQYVESSMLTIRGQQVILDSDVATLYGVETKRINEAVRNNPDKFPTGYVFALTDEETSLLRHGTEQAHTFADENFDRKKRVSSKPYFRKQVRY